ncbi:MAG: ABC transporter permease [Acidobacteria bacterium]|nr:MAG: ABC transporter permease [Acidobacteriota bacterium]
MRNVMEDVRYGLRLLRKSPAFTIVAVLTLALGIGANTAIYTLLDQALLRSLPVKEPNRLVFLRFSGGDTGSTHARGGSQKVFSYPMYRDLRDRNSVFSGLIATAWAQVSVQWHNQPDLADAELVSGNYFDVLGLQPALGRLLVSSDDLVQEGNPVAVLSFNYWQRRFGADPKIVNQSISINGHPFTVIGVAPPSFHSVVSGDNPGVLVPMTMKPEITPGWNDLEERRSKWLNIVGRFKPGLTHPQGQAAIDALWRSIRAEELKQIGRTSQRFRDAFLTNSHLFLHDGSKGVPMHATMSTTLLIVMALAGLVAFMSCANVASLLLVRVARRTREISVRYALGAQRRRLMQQLLAEGMLLGLAGGAIGIVVAPQIAALLIHTILSGKAGHLAFSSRPDQRILMFNFGLTLFVSVLFSLVPALQFRRPDVTQALKQQAAVVAGGSAYLRCSSVAAQIALSLLLLIGAGLFARSLHNLKTLDVGFTTDHLLTFAVDPKLAGYEDNQTIALYQEILDKLASMPGLRSAAATNDPELAENNWGNNITIAGYRAAEGEDMNVEWARVSAKYFSTMKMPLLAGREIEEHDRSGTQKVAVVNETFARRYFGRPQDALGHYFCAGAGDVKPNIEIVGVVKDAKHNGVRENIRRAVFTPYLQDSQLGVVYRFGMTFYVRTWQDPKAAESTIRAGMQALDSKLVLDAFRTMQEQVDENLSDDRVIALLATSFGLLAALMAAIGIYGVLAYSAAQRTREIGIRIAMGASRSEVVRMVLSDVARLATIGIALGMPLALLLTRTVRNRLFGISNYDPVTLVVVCAAILAVALAAAALPARRAAKVDPMVALRYE